MEGLDLGQTSNPRKMDVLKINDDDDMVQNKSLIGSLGG